ncbi:uncharacterized protein HHUB_2209 [Halobacterium hubeiense]|uniref:Uncharacterized protein n=1 Tax=Halobacterium hubeiense TaxID=1407499 RepID=A0A0U5CXW3_9EURY|nr:hypothetical protein [Halobacterium hubeiense]CQH55264.1 uncharacterized protein HHUB_2209 [Halobacterium hubeiense]
MTQMKVQDREYYAAGIAIIVLGFGISLTVWWFWGRLPNQSRAMLVASSLGATGTLILAGATLISIRQQTATVEKIQREREKPLVIDEIVQVLDYAIEGCEDNIRAYEKEDLQWNWVLIDGPQNHYTAGRVSGVINQSPDSAALYRLKNADENLWNELVEYEELIENLADLGDEAAEKIRPRIKEFVEEEEIKDPRGEYPDIDTLVYGAVKRSNEFGENSELYEVWESYGDEFCQTAREEAGIELEKIERGEENLVNRSKDLLEALRDRKVSLRREYGISQRELDEADIAGSIQLQS